MTSLVDEEAYTTEALIKLYKDRWEIENYYRNEKMWLTIQEFMRESTLGVTQELFAAMIMSLVTRVAIYIEESGQERKGEPQYYNAITAIGKAVPRIIALGIVNTIFTTIIPPD